MWIVSSVLLNLNENSVIKSRVGLSVVCGWNGSTECFVYYDEEQKLQKRGRTQILMERLD